MKLAFVCIALCVVIQTISANGYYRSKPHYPGPYHPPAPHYPTCNKCQKRVRYGSYGHYYYKCVAKDCNKKCGPCGTCQCNPKTGLQSCKCRGDYSGDTCQTNKCTTNYCANGGTCVGNTNTCKVSCKCTKCWKGPRCRKEIECSKPCGSCGTCKCNPSTGLQSCTCIGDYDGPLCKKNPCDNKNYCKNGGRCVTKNCKASCICNKCYNGDHCENKLDCTRKCGNCGRCVCIPRKGQFCRCYTGWSGPFCKSGPCVPKKKTCPSYSYKPQRCLRYGKCGYKCVASRSYGGYH